MRAFLQLVIGASFCIACSSNDDVGSNTDAAADVAIVDASVDVVEAGPSCSSGGAGGAAGNFSKSMLVNHVTRTYVIDVPDSALSQDGGCGAPLLIGLHGAGDTASNFLAYTQLPTAANTEGFILIGPNALGGAWYLTAAEGWGSPDGNPTSLQNDVAFVLQLIADASNAYNVDPTHIYVCGWSRGGGFTGVLATASGNPATITGLASSNYVSPFAGYGISAGYDYFGGMLALDASAPQSPVWLIHGTADQNVPFSDGQTFANELNAVGWPATFTPVTAAPHDWLWQTKYGHSDTELWSFFMMHALGQ